ncbi:interleukin-1 receptor type 2-like isoform 2-T2 [Aulostomus maculatus]
MRPSAAVRADGFPVYSDEAPVIILPDSVEVVPGGPLTLKCRAFPKSFPDETLIYWLVNGSFPENAHSKGRITESPVSSFQDGEILQRNLLLANVTLEDLKSSFTCVVMNSSGSAQQTITLTLPR